MDLYVRYLISYYCMFFVNLKHYCKTQEKNLGIRSENIEEVLMGTTNLIQKRPNYCKIQEKNLGIRRKNKEEILMGTILI